MFLCAWGSIQQACPSRASAQAHECAEFIYPEVREEKLYRLQNRRWKSSSLPVRATSPSTICTIWPCSPPPHMALWHSPASIPMHHHKVVHRFYMWHAKRGNLMHRVAKNANVNREYNAPAKDITISCAHAAAPRCAKLDTHVHHRQYNPTAT